MRNFNKVINELIKEHSGDKDKFCNDVGVTSQYLYLLETNRRNITYEFIEKLINALSLEGYSANTLRKTMLGRLHKKTLKIEGNKLNDFDFYLATLFVNSVDNLPDESKKEMEKLLLTYS